MVAHARIDGVWVGTLFPTAEMKHSTGWYVDEPSGDLRASVQVSCDPNYQAPWTLPGKVFDIWAPNGGRLWGGVTVEPDRDDGGLTLHARGIGSLLAKADARYFQADVLPSGEDGWLPTFVPNDAVDEAEARGWPFHRGGVDLGSASVGTADDPAMVTVWEVLHRAATAQGKRVHVDSQGYITYRADPTSPMWTLSPEETYMGTADDQLVTDLCGYFLADIGGGNSTPIGYVAADAAAADKFGRVERHHDFRNLGAMSYADGVAYTEGRFTLVGGRMGWTKGVDLDTRNLRHITGAWADPRFVRAGEMLQVPGNIDARSNPTTRGAIRFVLSEVEVTEANDPSAFAAPVGFSPRDFEGVLAPPENPAIKEAA